MRRMPAAASKPHGTPDAPRVGVFWVHRGEVLAPICPVADGVDDGRFVNSPLARLSR
jgi:hypothetical protein